MKRDSLEDLTKWKSSKNRVPLIIRGARQVGKSWIVKEFAKSFSNFVEINFEGDKRAISFFREETFI